MKQLMFLVVFNLLSFIVFSQQSDYHKSFAWVVKTFEENDAGFSHIVERKGADYYKFYTDKYREKLSNIETEEEFVTLVNEWLHFFRKGHIGFYANENKAPNTLSKDSIIELYQNEDKIDLSEEEFKKYLADNRDKINPIEGIWTNNYYTLGIIRVDQENKFAAFIIKADDLYWLPKQKKAEFEEQEEGSFKVLYAMKDHSKKETKAELIGSSFRLMTMMNEIWMKKYPSNNLSESEILYLRCITSSKPFIQKLNDKTIYLRIPSFNYSEKAEIDNLLKKNDEMIKSTENLIIDIRNGTGGSDYSYFGLLPYLYTQPLRRLEILYRVTELNASAFENYAKQISDTSISNNLNRLASKIRNSRSKYYSSDDLVTIDSSYSKSLFPKEIAIICNKNNGSTDEAFLYDAKQSQKVKIFGTPTGGMLDLSNLNIVKSPDGKYTLVYALTISKRLPNYLIDGVGIQPDIYIDETISDIYWIDFVKKYLEQSF